MLGANILHCEKNAAHHCDTACSKGFLNPASEKGDDKILTVCVRLQRIDSTGFTQVQVEVLKLHSWLPSSRDIANHDLTPLLCCRWALVLESYVTLFYLLSTSFCLIAWWSIDHDDKQGGFESLLILDQMYCGHFLSEAFFCSAHQAGDFYFYLTSGGPLLRHPPLTIEMFLCYESTCSWSTKSQNSTWTNCYQQTETYSFSTITAITLPLSCSGGIAWWQARKQPSSAKYFCLVWNVTIVHRQGKHHAAGHMDNRPFDQLKILTPRCKVQFELLG